MSKRPALDIQIPSPTSTYPVVLPSTFHNSTSVFPMVFPKKRKLSKYSKRYKGEEVLILEGKYTGSTAIIIDSGHGFFTLEIPEKDIIVKKRGWELDFGREQPINRPRKQMKKSFPKKIPKLTPYEEQLLLHHAAKILVQMKFHKISPH